MWTPRKLYDYFTPVERLLWLSSVVLILGSFLLFQQDSYITLVASLIGATALIFMAKGNPISQVLIVIFSVLYGIVSYSFAYYGEMITYLGMTMPMGIVALVAWIRNPYKGNNAEVTVNKVGKTEALLLIPLTAAVTFVFYFILRYFHTANLIPSTLSVATSFAAAYLTARRSPFYALLYACNDAVLIVLWLLATMEDLSYLSMLICFVMFLVNDLYGFFSWMRMEQRQSV